MIGLDKSEIASFINCWNEESKSSKLVAPIVGRSCVSLSFTPCSSELSLLNSSIGSTAFVASIDPYSASYASFALTSSS